jgi:hypothetical protein
MADNDPTRRVDSDDNATRRVSPDDFATVRGLSAGRKSPWATRPSRYTTLISQSNNAPSQAARPSLKRLAVEAS